jgi:hypothetical protein
MVIAIRAVVATAIAVTVTLDVEASATVMVGVADMAVADMVVIATPAAVVSVVIATPAAVASVVIAVTVTLDVEASATEDRVEADMETGGTATVKAASKEVRTLSALGAS